MLLCSGFKSLSIADKAFYEPVRRILRTLSQLLLIPATSTWHLFLHTEDLLLGTPMSLCLSVYWDYGITLSPQVGQLEGPEVNGDERRGTSG